MRVACIQSAHGATWEENRATATRLLDEAASAGAEVALLPEYWFMPPAGGDGGAATRAWAGREAELTSLLAGASARTGMLVAGNTLNAAPAAIRNVLRVAEAGRVVWSQPKLHPMPREAEWGVVGGPRLVPHDVRSARFGALVCADVLYPEAARLLAIQGAEVVLVPVLSPLRDPDPTKAAREAVFVARAWDGGCFVLKAAGFAPGRIAGRSLVTAPWGVVAKSRSEDREEVLLADLDLAALRGFRREQRGLQDRRPDAYGDLAHAGGP